MMGNLTGLIKNLMFGASAAWRQYRIAGDGRYALNRQAAELIRRTHSVEKGLSIAAPRLGFGRAKQREMLALMAQLSASADPYHAAAVRMAASALAAYIRYHEERGVQDDFIAELRGGIAPWLPAGEEHKDGGTRLFSREEMTFDPRAAEALFRTRHSIRDFEDTPVDFDRLSRAVRLAQSCPSACNRQGVRVYVYDREKAGVLRQWLTGVGGFEEDIGAFILVTAKLSAYRQEERYQYIVSASMYAAYLTMTLHACGLGACVVQRPVVANRAWVKTRRALDIDADEQAVCVLGVGNLRPCCRVPVSARLPEDVIARYVR